MSAPEDDDDDEPFPWEEVLTIVWLIAALLGTAAVIWYGWTLVASLP